jgi:hypothetical protein
MPAPFLFNFFLKKKAGLDWEALEAQRLVAPFLPAVDSDADVAILPIVGEDTVKGKGVLFGGGGGLRV